MNESLELHIKDEEQRQQHPNYFGIREIIQDQLDLQQGIIKSRYLLRDLNKKFDIKHNYNLGYPAKGIKQLPRAEYEGKKIYTIARVLGLYKVLK